MNQKSDAKIRRFGAEYKYLGVFLVCLLRQGGWICDKGAEGDSILSDGWRVERSLDYTRDDREGDARDDKLHSRIKIKAFLFCILLTYTYLCTQQRYTL